MNPRPVTLACVVEGHGEYHALPLLLERLCAEVAPGVPVSIRRPPFRRPRSKLLQQGELERTVASLGPAVRGKAGGIRVLLDANDDCPAELGPRLLERAQDAAGGVPVAVVLAKREFEAWFLAAASSLAGKRGLPNDLADHDDPEGVRDAKGWLRDRMPPGTSYSESVDQPALSAHLNIGLVAARSPSFRKLRRAVVELLGIMDEPRNGPRESQGAAGGETVS